MTEEQITAKKQFAGEKKATMKRRDDHHEYSGIGNRTLLSAPRRLAVRVSRRLNEQEVESQNYAQPLPSLVEEGSGVGSVSF